MSREDNIRTAKETIANTKARRYSVNGKEISLGDKRFSDVLVVKPEENIVIKVNPEGKTNYRYANADTFEAARAYCKNPLVLNFASAKYPGGGFEKGASAQEEALCRASTLYASLSTKEAFEMYDYNRNHNLPCYSDYMLLSKNVAVFRNSSGALIREPFECGVITVPAPNRSGPARNVPHEELDRIAVNRLRRMLTVAVNNGYNDIVLGAWGCGVFANKAEDVAGYFHTLLVDEGFEKYFDTIVFAVFHDNEKLKAFQNAFGK